MPAPRRQLYQLSHRRHHDVRGDLLCWLSSQHTMWWRKMLLHSCPGSNQYFSPRRQYCLGNWSRRPWGHFSLLLPLRSFVFHKQSASKVIRYDDESKAKSSSIIPVGYLLVSQQRPRFLSKIAQTTVYWEECRSAAPTPRKF